VRLKWLSKNQEYVRSPKMQRRPWSPTFSNSSQEATPFSLASQKADCVKGECSPGIQVREKWKVDLNLCMGMGSIQCLLFQAVKRGDSFLFAASDMLIFLLNKSTYFSLCFCFLARKCKGLCREDITSLSMMWSTGKLICCLSSKL